MSTTAWLDTLFSAIDAKDAPAFVGHLAADAEFAFGNLPPVKGGDAIAAMVGGFFAGVRSLRHTLAAHWECGDTVICHGSVTYTRHDGGEVTVPFANIMRREDGRAADYRIYADVSPLFAPAA